MEQMPILERRRIEAEVLAHVYATAEKRLGREEARALLGEAVSNSAIAHGQGFAAATGHTPDLADFLAILPLWTKNGALEIEVLEQSPTELSFNVTRCRYCEMYTEMGLREIGDLLSCNRDGDFCVGYNPAIELTRTQTIMGGAKYCDFRYRLPAAAEDAD